MSNGHCEFLNHEGYAICHLSGNVHTVHQGWFTDHVFYPILNVGLMWSGGWSGDWLVSYHLQ